MKFYISQTANRVLLGEKVTEFKETRLFTVSIIDNNDEYIILKYSVEKYSIEGNARVHKWMEELEDIQRNLVLKYNFTSQTITIENKNEINRKWSKDVKYRIQQKYSLSEVQPIVDEIDKMLCRKENLEKQFLEYTVFRAFFSGVYSISKTLNLDNFFGDIDLNLLVETERIDDNKFRNYAKINEDLLNREKLTKMLREITHTIDIIPELEIDMEEIYELDIDKLPRKVDLYLDLSVISGFYHTTIAHQIIQIGLEEFNDIKNGG